MARDLTPPRKLTDAELDAVAEVTDEDLIRAQRRADTLATPKMKQILSATVDERTDRTPPKIS